MNLPKSVTEWHAPGKFCVETGERNVVTPTEPTPPLFRTYSAKHYLNWLNKMKKILAITPAMPSGCSMTNYAKELPDRVSMLE